jgi:hypothetical protein
MPDVSESSLEQNFSDLASARLRDKAPQLVDYMVGFQLLKTDEDGSKAVGIFGFEVGDSWYYAAVFFLNGQVKGLDSLYSVDSDLFMPISEDWVNQVVNKRPNQLGEPDTRDRDERGTRLPNYTRMRTIPGGVIGGIGTGLSPGFGKQGSVPIIDQMTTPRDVPLTPLPELLAEAGPHIANGFVADLNRYPKLAALVSQHYCFSDFDTFALPKTAAPKDESVTIISSVAQPGADKLTDAEKEQLISGGTAVVDKRPDTVKSQTYRTESRQLMQNPAGGGLYRVLMADGTFEDMFCLKLLGGDNYLCYQLSDGRHGIMNPLDIWTIQQYEPSIYRERLEKETSKPSQVRPQDCVAFCNTSGDSTLAFEVESVIGGTDGVKLMKVHRSYWLCGDCSAHSYNWLQDGPAPWRYAPADERIKDILVSDAGSGAIRYYHKQLIVNDSRFRALVLNRKDNDEFSYDSPWDSIQLRARDFGDHNTLRIAFSKMSSALTIQKTANGFCIQDGDETIRGGDATVLRHLILKHGCAVEDVRDILKTVGTEPESVLIKRAGELLDIPELYDRSESGEMSSYHPTEVPTYGVNMETPKENREQYMYNSPYAGFNDDDPGAQAGSPAEESVKDTVDTAAKSGQKDVFDASILMSLVKTHDPVGMADKFLPTLVSGMDRCGRLLFLLHWQFDEFKERYGAQDMTSFTDDLTSTFEALGDVILFLRKRTLAGDPQHLGLGLSSSMDG